MSALTIGAIIVCLFLIIASMNKGSTKMSKPSRLRTFTTDKSKEMVLKTILKFAQSNGYKIDDFNEAEAIIVLSDSATLTSFGNIYPVFVTEIDDNLVKIEVGIKSKAMQQGGLNVLLDQCCNGIKVAIYQTSE